MEIPDIFLPTRGSVRSPIGTNSYGKTVFGEPKEFRCAMTRAVSRVHSPGGDTVISSSSLVTKTDMYSSMRPGSEITFVDDADDEDPAIIADRTLYRGTTMGGWDSVKVVLA